MGSYAANTVRGGNVGTCVRACRGLYATVGGEQEAEFVVTKQFRNATRRSDEREPAVLPLELLAQYEQESEKSGVHGRSVGQVDGDFVA